MRQQSASMRTGWVIAALFTMGVPWFVGCGGAMNFGGEIRVPVEKRHAITAGPAAGGRLKLPADHPFNIHVKRSNQDLAGEGQARGESDAGPTGQAMVHATASNGGSATASFQIGHRLDNRSDQVQSAAIQVEFDLNDAINASEIPKPETIAKADLQLVILDARKRTVVKTIVVQATSDDATGNATGVQRRSLAAKFEPNQSYDVMLCARVEVTTAAGQEASARIDIKELKMDLTFSIATTQATAMLPANK